MRLILFPKLVRDFIPAQIRGNGGKCFVRVLEGREYRKALLKKLVEEAKEVSKAKDQQELAAELGDVLDLVETIRVANRIGEQELLAWRSMKQRRNGMFAKGFKLLFAFGGKKNASL